MKVVKVLVLFVLLYLFFVTAKDVQADPLKGKRFVADVGCTVGNPTYIIPCKEYEDDEYLYYPLARENGTVVVIKRISKATRVVENYWTSPEIAEIVEQFDRVHSF